MHFRLNAELTVTACVFGALLCSSGSLFGEPEDAGSRGTVKVTPLGSKSGEFCSLDRAMVFEDPGGVRILYDPGSTVAGSADSRLGEIDVTLLSHVHADHIGTAKLNQDPNAPSAKCDSTFPSTPVVPGSNLAEITALKNAAFIGTPPDATFLGAKIQSFLGSPVGVCGSNPSAGISITVPLAAPCLGFTHFGAETIVQRAGTTGRVRISVVTAKHDNSVPAALLSDPLKTELSLQGLAFQPGDPVGYLITFSNGLTAYLSGDTGQTADMRFIVRDQYRAKLAVINIGDVFTTGPEEAAYAMNQLVRPESVIPSHANEVATSGGTPIPGTRTANFLSLLEMPGYAPLSGHTLQFDGRGRCVAGCK